MSRGINKVILVGHIGKDPEIKYMANGDAFTNVSIATAETWKDKLTGESKEKTEWHNVVFFKKLAEIVDKYVKKGSLIYIEGSLKNRKYTDKNGVERYVTDVIASSMQMLGGKSDQHNIGNHELVNSIPDDEIPF